MRNSRLAMACLLVLGLAPVASADHHEALLREVEAIGDAVAKSMLENDLDAMLAMYAEDAISLPNYSPRMEGLDTFREHHAQMEASGVKVRSFTSDPTHVWEAGNQVIEIGTFEIELEMAGMPAPIEDRGKYLTVYERQEDGSLKIKAEIWNTDMNPMMEGMGEPGAGHSHEDGG